MKKLAVLILLIIAVPLGFIVRILDYFLCELEGEDE